jgi:hypothetical protein
MIQDWFSGYTDQLFWFAPGMGAQTGAQACHGDYYF